MSRTLHVIDQPGPVAEAAVLRFSIDAARLETQAQQHQHAWLLFGGEATREAARSIGLLPQQFRLLPMPKGLHRLIPAAMRGPRRLLQQAHRVVCWTEGATQIASTLGCAHVVRRIDDATLCPHAGRIIQEAHDSGPAHSEPTRDKLRQRWGVNADTRVIALLADRFDAIDASAAMMTIAFTHEAVRAYQPESADVRLLCHPLAMRRDQATALGSLLGFDQLLIQEPAIAEPWSVLAGCDAVLAPRLDDAGLSILWASASGVPVFAPIGRQHAMREKLVTLVPTRSSLPRDMADALTQWAKSGAIVAAAEQVES